MKELTAEDYARYERHLVIEGFGDEEQQKLKSARVLVVGAGGLGSVVLQYLIAGGVGHIGMVEFDFVAPSNLNRQILYTSRDIGQPKIELAAQRLMEMNPSAQVETYAVRLTDDNAREIFSGYDMVVDCTDNFTTRNIIDKYSRETGIPMIYGSVQEGTGQVAILNYKGGIGYADLFPDAENGDDGKPVGVLSPMPGIVGCIQAMEVFKLITGYKDPLIGKLLTIDAGKMEFNLYSL